MTRFSFTKADRILNRGSFVLLAKTGKTVRNREFIGSFSPGKYDRTRLGITVSRKVGHAVKRNSIKRLAREHFRLNRHSFRGKWDIVLIAKKEAASLSSEQIFHSLKDIFGRISRKPNR